MPPTLPQTPGDYAALAALISFIWAAVGFIALAASYPTIKSLSKSSPVTASFLTYLIVGPAGWLICFLIFIGDLLKPFFRKSNK